MFGFGNSTDLHPVDQPIKRVLDEMEMMGPDYEKYDDYVDYIERLHKLKREERKPKVSRDTLVTAGAYLAGVVIVAAFEKSGVWTSKALQVNTMKNPQINH